MDERYRCCEPDWFDADWSAAAIAAAVAEPDPVRGNLLITHAHDQLSLALRAVTGEDTGANFHTWAAWGSRKAGKTIRGEDTADLRRLADLTGLMVGAGAGWAAGRRQRTSRREMVARVALVGLIVPAVTRWRLRDTSRAVLAGNRTVLEDIGLATGRFVAAFHRRPLPDDERLARFESTLRPGPTERGGQELLRSAFRHYYAARQSRERKERLERMLLANYAAILHEHIRLDPYIKAAIPRWCGRQVTAGLLDFTLGDETLRVGADVPCLNGTAFPDALADIYEPDLRAFLSGDAGWDRTPDALGGSAAGDWKSLGDRMNYIVDLFRSRHLVASLFATPLTNAEASAVERARRRAGWPEPAPVWSGRRAGD